MGSLQQPSVLKGKKVITENDAIVPKIFQNIQAQFSQQIAIIYEGKNEFNYNINSIHFFFLLFFFK